MAVSVYVEGKDRIGKALPVPVQVSDKPFKGVGQRGLMERLVGVRHVKAVPNELGGEVLAHQPGALDGHFGVLILTPDGGTHAGKPVVRLDVHVFIGIDAEGGHTVLPKVLHLLFAPDENNVWVEVVDGLPELAEGSSALFLMGARRREPMVVAVFLAHSGGPIFRIT